MDITGSLYVLKWGITVRSKKLRKTDEKIRMLLFTYSALERDFEIYYYNLFIFFSQIIELVHVFYYWLFLTTTTTTLTGRRRRY